MRAIQRRATALLTLLLSCCFYYDCHAYHAFPHPAKRKAMNSHKNSYRPITTPKERPQQRNTALSSTSSSSASSWSWKSTPLRFLLRENNPEKAITGSDRAWGGVLAIIIILQLAFNTVEPVETGIANLADVTLPTDSTQVVSGAISEAISGIVGAIAAGLTQKAFAIAMPAMKNDKSGGSSSADDGEDSILTEGVANSDYFLASSASRPLFEAIGVPLEFVSIVSVVFAAVPYELTKLTGRRARSQRREQKQQKQLLLEEAEEELAKKKKQQKNLFPNFAAMFPSSSSSSSSSSQRTVKKTDAVNSDLITPETNATANIDVVEIFADVTKWLEYNVLMTEFGESLMLEGERSSTGALLGFIAAVSTQLYADVLYGYFQYGPEWRRQEIAQRTSVDWVAAYIPRALSSAALFGVYEWTQPPVSRYIQGMLAGGVDGCFGSEDFDMCLQTYINTNAPGPTAEAQFRALVTNLLMVAQRIQDVAGDTSSADFEALGRAWTVSFLSYIQNHPVHFLWFSTS